ncbi:MAG: carbohydrate kinase family protein [Clostridium sp.]
MKQHIAFIGSSVADVIIRIPHLPVRQEDINIESQTLSLGGCAFNAAWMCRLLGGDPLFFSPVGTGIYGDFVRRQLQEHRIDILLESKEENGCCFCLVESDGERTFLSHHGAEYRFQKEWFSLLDSYGVDTVYVRSGAGRENWHIHSRLSAKASAAYHLFRSRSTTVRTFARLYQDAVQPALHTTSK